MQCFGVDVMFSCFCNVRELMQCSDAHTLFQCFCNVQVLMPGMSVKWWHNCGEPQFGVVFPKKLCCDCGVHFPKICGRGLGCGGQNLKIVVVVGLGL